MFQRWQAPLSPPAPHRVLKPRVTCYKWKMKANQGQGHSEASAALLEVDWLPWREREGSQANISWPL